MIGKESYIDEIEHQIIFVLLLNIVMSLAINQYLINFQYNNQYIYIFMARKRQVRANNQQDQSNSDKHKPIKKEQKEKKPKKNGDSKKSQNQNDKVRRGRPPQNDPIIVEDDPTQNVQEHLLYYLDKIGLRHGLVFRKQERVKLKQKWTHIKWKDDHQWDEKVERKKVQENKKLMSQIYKSIALLNQSHEQAKDLYIDTIVNIGDIAAQECTSQVYQLIAEALQSINKRQGIEQQNQRGKKFFDDSLFMSGKFGYGCQTKHWIEIKQSMEAQNRIHFVQMFKKQAISVKQMFEDLDKIRRFQREQKQMNQKLRQIIEKSQFKKA